MSVSLNAGIVGAQLLLAVSAHKMETWPSFANPVSRISLSIPCKKSWNTMLFYGFWVTRPFMDPWLRLKSNISFYIVNFFSFIIIFFSTFSLLNNTLTLQKWYSTNWLRLNRPIYLRLRMQLWRSSLNYLFATF